MRKKDVMLSLVAVTSAPMAAYANANLTGDIETAISKVAGQEGLNGTTGTTVVSTGTAATLQVGELVKGKYKLTYEAKNGNVTVKVNGSAVESGKSFTHDGGDVTIVIESAVANQSFAVNVSKFELDYKFNAAYSTLSTKLSSAFTSLPNMADADDWQKDLLTQYNGDLSARIAAIKDDTEDTQTAYNIYVSEELYADLEDVWASKLGKEINTFADDVKNANDNKAIKNYADTKIGELNASLTTLENNVNAADKGVQELFNAKYSIAKIKESITNLENAVKTAYEGKTAYKDYDEAGVDGTVGEINATIVNATTALGTFKTNYSAYTSVATAIENAEKAYNEASQSLIETLTGIYATYAGTEGKQSMLSAAQAELAEQYKVISDIKGKNTPEGTTEALKTEYISSLTVATGEISAIVSEFTTLKNDNETAHNTATEDIKNALQTPLDNQKTGLKDVTDEYDTEIAAIQGKIDAINTTIDEAYKNYAIAKETFTYAEAKEDALESLSALQGKTDATIANYNAYKDLTGALDGLNKKLTDANAAVAKCVSGDEEKTFDGATLWSAEAEEINKKLTDYRTAVETAFKEDKAVEYKNANLTTINAIATTISDYQSEVESAFEDYNAIVKAVKEYEDALAEVEKFVGDYGAVKADDGVTYEAKINALQGRIDDVDNARETAIMTKKGSELATALAAIDLDEAISTDIAAIDEDTFLADKNKWQGDIDVEAVKKQIANVQYMADQLSAALETFGENYTTETIGKGYEETIKSSYETLVSDLSAQVKLIPSADDVTAEYAAEMKATLTAINTEIAKLQTSLTSLENNAKEIKAKFDANETANTTAATTVSTLKTNAEKIKSENKDNSRVSEFTGLYEEVITSITTQETAIKVAYESETLVSAWEGDGTEENKGIEAALTDIETKIKGYIEQAQASTDNFNAYDTQSKVFGKAAFSSTITAVRSSLTAEPTPATGAALTYYNGLLDDYQKQASKLSSDIRQFYNDRKSVENNALLTGTISGLSSKISAVKNNAVENEKAHTDHVSKKNDTQTKWEEVYNELSANDKTDKLTEYLAQLTDIQNDINALNAEVEEKFGNGESAAADFNPVSTYSEYIVEINKVRASWDGAYPGTVEAENTARYKRFEAAIEEANKAYRDAVTSIAKFSNITDILDVNAKLYEYPELIRDLVKTASTEREKCSEEDRKVYDENEVHRKKAELYTAEIQKIYEGFTTVANEKALADYNTNMTEARQTLTDALATLEGYDESVKNAAFQDIRDIISKHETAGADPELAVHLDGILTDLNSIQDLVEPGKEAAAQAEYGFVMAELAKTYEAELEELGGFTYAESNTVDYEGDYKAAYELYITGEGGAQAIGTAAIEAGDMFGDNLTAVKQKIEDFKTNNKYTAAQQAAKDNAASLESYDNMVKKFTELENALKAAKEYADVYVADASQIDQVQRQIDEQKATAETYKKVGTADDVEDEVLEKCEGIATTIEGLNAIADSKEYAALLNAIEVLKAEYNKAAAEKGDAVLHYEETIAGYSKQLDAINGQETDKQQGFIELEKAIAETRTALANEYDASLVESTYSTLVNNINSIKAMQETEVADLEGCHAVVQEAYKKELDAILVAANAVQAEVEADKAANTLLFYNENLTKEIAAIASDLKTLAEEIDAKQAPYTANEEAYTTLKTELDELQGEYEALAQKLSEYSHVDMDVFAENAKTFVTDRIDTDRQTLEAAHNATDLDKMLTADSKNANAIAIKNAITCLDKYGSKAETDGRIADLKSAWTTVKGDINGKLFTPEKDAEIDQKIEDLDKALEALEVYNGKAVDGYIEKDINGDALVGEDGKEIESKSIDFVKEAVPEIFAKVESLTAEIKALETEAEENSYILGDVNRDGSVLVNDYTLILNMTLGLETAEEGSVEFLAADVNENGRINIGDVTAVRRIVNGVSVAKTSYAKARRVATFATTEVNDAISLSSEGEGTKQRIAINLQNSRAYNACQMDVKLPAGVTLAGESLGSRADGLTLYSNDLDNGTHRIVLSSLDDVEIAEGAGAIIYLDVEVGYSYSGEGIEVSDVLFTDSDARLYSIGGVSGNETTGINTVTLGEAVKGKVYSVGGKLLKGLQRGVNIIRGDDGSTKKVIVK